MQQHSHTEPRSSRHTRPAQVTISSAQMFSALSPSIGVAKNLKLAPYKIRATRSFIFATTSLYAHSPKTNQTCLVVIFTNRNAFQSRRNNAEKKTDLVARRRTTSPGDRRLTSTEGRGKRNSRSKRPGRRRAGSMLSMRLVAPMTTTSPRLSSPSIRASSVDTIELWIWSWRLDRTGARPSISSKKMIDGRIRYACSRRRRHLASERRRTRARARGPTTVTTAASNEYRP